MKWEFLTPLLLFSALFQPVKAMAHGVKIEHRMTQVLEIQATYDTGTPLKNAQVTVYAPENPTIPWKQGMTDEKGNFMFIPDEDQNGYWEVKVRQAGHGGIVSIPMSLESNSQSLNSDSQNQKILPKTSEFSAAYTPVQKGLMIGSVVWGCVGTALFFAQFNRKNLIDNSANPVRHQESEG